MHALRLPPGIESSALTLPVSLLAFPYRVVEVGPGADLGHATFTFFPYVVSDDSVIRWSLLMLAVSFQVIAVINRWDAI